MKDLRLKTALARSHGRKFLKIIIANGLVYYMQKHKDFILNAAKADSISMANGYGYAENMTKELDGKTVFIDEYTLKIDKGG